MNQVINYCLFSLLLFTQILSFRCFEIPFFNIAISTDSHNRDQNDDYISDSEIEGFTKNMTKFLKNINNHSQKVYVDDATEYLENFNITDGQTRAEYFNNLTSCINETLEEIKIDFQLKMSSEIFEIENYQCKENSCNLNDRLILDKKRNNLFNQLNETDRKYIKKLRGFARQIDYRCQDTQNIFFKNLSSKRNITLPHRDRHDDKSFLSQLNRTNQIKRELKNFLDDMEVNLTKNYSTYTTYNANEFMHKFIINSTLKNFTCHDIASQQSQIFENYSKNTTKCIRGKMNKIKSYFKSKLSEIRNHLKNYECRRIWCSNIDGILLEVMNNDYESQLNKLKNQTESVSTLNELTQCCQKAQVTFELEIQKIDFKSC